MSVCVDSHGTVASTTASVISILRNSRAARRSLLTEESQAAISSYRTDHDDRRRSSHQRSDERLQNLSMSILFFFCPQLSSVL